MCAPVYQRAAERGVSVPDVKECELWEVGAMLGTFDLDAESRRRRDDAEVFQARIDAAERGEDYEPDLEPFDITAIAGPLAPPPPRLVPPAGPGVN